MPISKPTNAKHKAIYLDIIDVMRKHANDMPPTEQLAILSNIVGKILALQDQRTMTPEMGMKIIAANIEEGNRQAIAELHNTRGSG